MIFFDLESNPNIISFHWNKLKPLIERKVIESSINKGLKTFISENLEEIICSKPKRLVQLNKELKSHSAYKQSLDSKIKKIFNYSNFVKKKQSENSYDGYDLAEKLGVRVCLYCNRMYTLTVKKSRFKKDKLTRPQFDHFIDKGKNPLLALSIYNLIPSCNICNSTLKGTTEFSIRGYIHPFIDDCVDDYYYSFIPYDVESIISGKSNLEVNIKFKDINSQIGKKINKSAELFRLNEIMSAHKEELKDLFDIRYKFSERYFLELFNTYKGLGLEKKEIYRIVFGSEYENDDYGRRPFSKIKKDILQELNII